MQNLKTFNAQKQELMVYMEYCNEIDLRNHLISYDRKNADQTERPLKKIVTMITQLLLAMEECHHQGFVHRNMSDEHIFVRNDGGKLSAVLANFGNTVSKAAGTATASTSSVNAGNLYYFSPENVKDYLRQQEVQNVKGIDKKEEQTFSISPGQRTDVFGLGVILLHLCLMKDDIPKEQHGLAGAGNANPAVPKEGVTLWAQERVKTPDADKKHGIENKQLKDKTTAADSEHGIENNQLKDKINKNIDAYSETWEYKESVTFVTMRDTAS